MFRGTSLAGFNMIRDIIDGWIHVYVDNRKAYLSIVAKDVFQLEGTLGSIRRDYADNPGLIEHYEKKEGSLRAFLYALLQLEQDDTLDEWADVKSSMGELRVCILQMRGKL